MLTAGLRYDVHGMANHLAFGLFITRLLVGAALGVIVGFERQLRNSPAGAHTTGLVAAGAAAFVTIGPALALSTPDRIIANIVTGVGFLAGGVILHSGVTVTGLNTAATIWATAAIGALAGVGLFREALSATAVILTINLLSEPVVNRIRAQIGNAKNRR
jgi:putative Mg2+ transporter-C (MgtC) family protein